MPHEVIMPALGMAQETGQIVAWHRSAGDAVKADDVLFEVETDKSTVEVPAGADGFVTRISHPAGSEVPVGEVIALIGDTAEESAADAPASAPGEAAKEVAVTGQEVIMPALGMAQDSGVIVAWHKAPGDAVAASDVLFEVETDKATMDVEAGHDGYVAALYAETGEDAPVGAVIAVISAEKPETPVQRSLAAKPAAKAPAGRPKPAQAAETPPPKPPASKTPARKGAIEGPILASPKARRLAAEEGLDLSRLAAEGIAMPYHVADLDTLRALPAADANAAPAASASALHVTARVPQAGFAAFADWLRDRAPREAAFAAFAAASLRAATGAETLTLRLDQPTLGRSTFYADPDLGPLSAAAEMDDGAPTLILRDLTASRITGGSFGPGAAPTLGVTTEGGDYVLTLDYAAGQLSAEAAIILLDGFAGRLEEPLRHLL